MTFRQEISERLWNRFNTCGRKPSLASFLRRALKSLDSKSLETVILEIATSANYSRKSFRHQIQRLGCSNATGIRFAAESDRLGFLHIESRDRAPQIEAVDPNERRPPQVRVFCNVRSQTNVRLPDDTWIREPLVDCRARRARSEGPR
jgi:hypothetical protein